MAERDRGWAEPAPPSQRLHPDDIVTYELKQSMRGYNVRQVDELLDRVADELDRLHRDLADARRSADEAEQRAASAAETEATLKRTLITAERLAEQSIREARQQATELLADARKEAEALRVAAKEAAERSEAELRDRLGVLEERVESLRSFERKYRADLEAVVERLREDLEGFAASVSDEEAQEAEAAP